MTDENGRADAPPEQPSSAGWSTFEARMRRRRFDRCVMTTRDALNAGNNARAKEALTEARALFSDAPEVHELEQRVAAQQARVVRVVKEAPVSRPPVIKAPIPSAPRVELAHTVRSPVASTLFGSSPISSEPAGETELLLRVPDGRPGIFASMPEYSSSTAARGRSRRVVGPLIGMAAVVMFGVGGYQFAQFYLDQPGHAAATTTVAMKESAAAPATPTTPDSAKEAPPPVTAPPPIDTPPTADPSQTPSAQGAQASETRTAAEAAPASEKAPASVPAPVAAPAAKPA